MENSLSHPRKFNVNLKHLPPINPRIGSHPSIPGRYEKPRNTRCLPEFMPPSPRQEMKPNGRNGSPTKPVPSGTVQAENMKTIPVASLGSTDFRKFSSDRNNQISREEGSNCSYSHGSTGEGTPEKGEAKCRLFEICIANKWKPPLFECCEEEGPSHAKLFAFKVIVEMKGASSTVLECYGARQTRKKVAAEHAAEGALWYLKHLGYFRKR